MTTRTPRKSPAGRATPRKTKSEEVQLVRPDSVIAADAKRARAAAPAADADPDAPAPRGQGKFVTVRGLTVDEPEVIFDLVDEVPGFLILELGTLTDKSAPDIERLRAMNDFVKVAVAPDQRYEFAQHVRQAVPVIGMEETQEIIERMVKQLLHRP